MDFAATVRTFNPRVTDAQLSELTERRQAVHALDAERARLIRERERLDDEHAAATARYQDLLGTLLPLPSPAALTADPSLLRVVVDTAAGSGPGSVLCSRLLNSWLTSIAPGVTLGGLPPAQPWESPARVEARLLLDNTDVPTLASRVRTVVEALTSLQGEVRFEVTDDDDPYGVTHEHLTVGTDVTLLTLTSFDDEHVLTRGTLEEVLTHVIETRAVEYDS